MPANLRFIAHAAERDARKLPPQRVRHALAQRRLAHARRPGQAQDRAFEIVLELDDREEFQQPVLHLFQPEMLLIKNAFRRRQIERVGARARPRHRHQPIEIIARDRVFGHRRRGLLEPVQFLQRDLLDLLGQLVFLDQQPQVVHLARPRLALAQLALDGPHLLAQEKFALALGHRTGDVVLNLRADVQHLDLAPEQRQQPRQPRLDPGHLQQLLPLLEIEIEIGRDQVRQRGRILRIEHRDLHLLGDRR